MKKLLVGGLLVALFFGHAHAQQALVVSACGTPPTTYTAGQQRLPTVDTTGKLCLSSSGVPPTGAAGGDLTGTYPNPTLAWISRSSTSLTLNIGAGGTLGALSFITPGSGVATALGVNIGSVGAPVLFNGAGGTPSSLVGTNITGTAAGLTAGTVTTIPNLSGDVTSSGNVTTLVTAQPGAHTWAAAQTINLNSAAALTPVAGTALQVAGANSTIGRVQATSFGAIASFTAARANGTGASPTAVVSGDQIGGVNAYSYVTSASPGFVGPVASYQTFATENHTTTAMGSKAVIATTPNGSTTLTTALTVDQDQSTTLVGRLTAAGITNTGNGAASVAQSLWSGTVLTGGTSTTNFPAMFVQPTGTSAVTSWSTSGTGFGMNLVSGFAGNFLDFHVAGAASVFSVSSAGQLSLSSNILGGAAIRASSNFQLQAGGTILSSPGAAIWMLGNGDQASGAVSQTLTFQGNTGSTTNGPLALIRGAGGGSSTSVGGELRLSGGLSSAAPGTGGAVTVYAAPAAAGNAAALIATFAANGNVSIATTTDASASSGSGSFQVAGGASIAKRFWLPAITASSGLQTAVLCQSSGGEVIADSVACLASSARFKNIRGPLSSDIVDKFMKLPIKVWAYKEEGIFKKGNWTRDRIGPIAEDVEKLDPRLVEYDKDGQVRAYSTEQLLAYTIKVVQEQQVQIDGLRARRH